jgi:hypothetical protein
MQGREFQMGATTPTIARERTVSGPLQAFMVVVATFALVLLIAIALTNVGGSASAGGEAAIPAARPQNSLQQHFVRENRAQGAGTGASTSGASRTVNGR